MKTLSNIFGGEAKVKLMRLFLFNPDHHFFLDNLTDKTRASTKEVREAIVSLENSRMIKKRKSIHFIEKKKGKKVTHVKRKSDSWKLDPTFEYLLPMQNLLISSRPLRQEEIVKRFTGVGKLKMVIVSGVFIQNTDSRVDMLIVGDHLKKGAIDRIIKSMESEIGKELRYTSFETSDFQYRIAMCDKLVRDILDYPHQKLLDKLGIDLAKK